MIEKKKKLFTKQRMKEFLLINLGVFMMAAAYSVLLDANNIIVGGIGGLATLLRAIFKTIPSSFFILALNLILLVFAFIFVSKEFFIKTIYASIVYPLYTFLWEIINQKLLTNMLPNIVEVSNQSNLGVDPRILTAGAYLVIVLFGAFISGVGLGLALRNGASTGGVDIIQRIFLKYLKMPLSASMIIIDGAVVLIAGIYFKDLFIILYGGMFIFISGFVMDAIVFSGFNARCVNIVTTKPNEIRDKIFEVLERGVTLVDAKGGYTEEDKTLLICVMSNSEFYKMKELIQAIDAKAFIYITRASEVHGEGFSPDIPSIKD